MKNYKIDVNQRVILAYKHLLERYKHGEIAYMLGVKSNKLSEIMSGRMAAGLDVICGLCSTFSVSPDYLLLGMGDMMRPQGGRAVADAASGTNNCEETIARLNRIIEAQDSYILSLKADMHFYDREKSLFYIGEDEHGGYMQVRTYFNGYAGDEKEY